MTSSASRTLTAAPSATILVDVRGLTEGAGWEDVLDAARPVLPDVRLEALIDPAGPALPPAIAARFDAIHPNAYRAGPPDCLVRLRPGADPLFAARPLLTAPSVALEPIPLTDPLRQATAHCWLQRSIPVDRANLWPTVRAVMRSPRPNPARAILTFEPRGAAYQEGATVFGPNAPVTTLFSPRFGQVAFALRGRPEEAGLLAALLRFGGDLVLEGTSLLLAYAAERAALVAARELGRVVPATEVAQWRAGIARPAALLLGEAVAAARHVSASSACLASEIRRRHRVEASVAPIRAAPVARGPDGTVVAHAAGLWAEACIWSLAILRWWGLSPRLLLDGPAGERPALRALAERVGVVRQLSFGGGDAAVTAVLAMRGEGASAAPLVAALPVMRCVATATLAEAIGGLPGLAVLPDQASPPLLAAALRNALAA